MCFINAQYLFFAYFYSYISFHFSLLVQSHTISFLSFMNIIATKKHNLKIEQTNKYTLDLYTTK